ncbi:MAG: CYTH domain-containing protein [Eubacteriaceae bacterium]|jgi:inorganic triphosphatase YgiF|nr:CYTH domain-containing protein [Eubacteriaceae bacterium]
MEIELKYALENNSKADRIWNDSALALLSKGTDDERRTEMFESTYYDTADHVLLRNDIAYRVRKEDSRAVASLKWNGKSEGPLHIREELNASLGEWNDDIRPDPHIFSQSEIGAELLSLIGGSELIPLMKVNFRRRMFRADTGNSLLEFSLDEGEILTENGSMPISELEIELFSGEKDALEDLGMKLQKKYDLKPEKDSKFARGLMLMNLI